MGQRQWLSPLQPVTRHYEEDHWLAVCGAKLAPFNDYKALLVYACVGNPAACWWEITPASSGRAANLRNPKVFSYWARHCWRRYRSRLIVCLEIRAQCAGMRASGVRLVTSPPQTTKSSWALISLISVSQSDRWHWSRKAIYSLTLGSVKRPFLDALPWFANVGLRHDDEDWTMVSFSFITFHGGGSRGRYWSQQCPCERGKMTDVNWDCLYAVFWRISLISFSPFHCVPPHFILAGWMNHMPVENNFNTHSSHQFVTCIDAMGPFNNKMGNGKKKHFRRVVQSRAGVIVIAIVFDCNRLHFFK